MYIVKLIYKLIYKLVLLYTYVLLVIYYALIYFNKYRLNYSKLSVFEGMYLSSSI